MWKANGKTTTLQLFLDSLAPKTEKLSLEGTMDLSRDRLILELGGWSLSLEYQLFAVQYQLPTLRSVSTLKKTEYA
jgi:hypothetical protein